MQIPWGYLYHEAAVRSQPPTLCGQRRARLAATSTVQVTPVVPSSPVSLLQDGVSAREHPGAGGKFRRQWQTLPVRYEKVACARYQYALPINNGLTVPRPPLLFFSPHFSFSLFASRFIVLPSKPSPIHRRFAPRRLFARRLSIFVALSGGFDGFKALAVVCLRDRSGRTVHVAPTIWRPLDRDDADIYHLLSLLTNKSSFIRFALILLFFGVC